MSANFSTAKCSAVIVVVGGLFVLIVTVDIFPTVFDKMNLIHVDSKYTMSVAADDESKVPFCVEGILDRRNFRVDLNKAGLFPSLMMIKPREPCRLHTYTMKDVLYCFSADRNGNISIAFVGDSRMRHQFLSFMKLIPDYDRQTNKELEEKLLHNDANVTSRLLDDASFQYRWHPEINEHLKNDLLNWVSRPSTAPDFILIGIGVWYIREDNYKGYIDSLTEIVPILQQLNDRGPSSSFGDHFPKVSWMNQYPIIDELFISASTGVTSQKIHHYNQATESLLRNNDIQVWDSSVAIDEDYLRACLFNSRHGFLLSDGKLLVSNGPYFNCKDYIHAGKVIVMQKSQILYNHLCNRHLLQLRNNKIIND